MPTLSSDPCRVKQAPQWVASARRGNKSSSGLGSSANRASAGGAGNRGSGATSALREPAAGFGAANTGRKRARLQSRRKPIDHRHRVATRSKLAFQRGVRMANRGKI